MRRLERPRDLAITDFRLALRPAGVLTSRSGRSYLVYASTVRLPPSATPARYESVSQAARRCSEWALYAFFSAATVAVIWFGFVAPHFGAPCCLDSQASHSFAPVSLRNFGSGPL